MPTCKQFTDKETLFVKLAIIRSEEVTNQKLKTLIEKSTHKKCFFYVGHWDLLMLHSHESDIQKDICSFIEVASEPCLHC